MYLYYTTHKNVFMQGTTPKQKMILYSEIHLFCFSFFLCKILHKLVSLHELTKMQQKSFQERNLNRRQEKPKYYINIIQLRLRLFQSISKQVCILKSPKVSNTSNLKVLAFFKISLGQFSSSLILLHYNKILVFIFLQICLHCA